MPPLYRRDGVDPGSAAAPSGRARHRAPDDLASARVDRRGGEHTRDLPGSHCKSLFVKDKKGELCLLVCLDHRRIDTGRLAKEVGSPRLSFGQPDLLQAVLGAIPGAVTPFALINDRERRVQPLLDQAMLAHAELNFHRLTNTAKTTIKATDLLRFLGACGHWPQILDVGATGIAKPAIT